MFALSLKMFEGDFCPNPKPYSSENWHISWKIMVGRQSFPFGVQSFFQVKNVKTKNQPWSQVTSGFPGDPSQNPNKKQANSNNLSSFLEGFQLADSSREYRGYPSERLGTYSRRVKKMVLISIVGWRRPLCEVWLATRSNFDMPRWSKDIENSRGIQEVYIVNSPHFEHLHSITANLHLFRNWRTPLHSPFFRGPNLFLYSSSKKDSGEKNRGGKILSKL